MAISPLLLPFLLTRAPYFRLPLLGGVKGGCPTPSQKRLFQQTLSKLDSAKFFQGLLLAKAYGDLNVINSKD